MNILLTGGAGFIGSHLADKLVELKSVKSLTIVDNLSNGTISNIKKIINNKKVIFVEGDIRDISLCNKVMKDVNVVLHQAALGSVPRSISDPITTNNVNITGSLNILVASSNANVKRVIFAASSSTYGDSKTLPKRESIIGKPLSPYAVTKYVNELYASVFARMYNMELIGLRYFNVYGPRQNPLGPYAAVIPIFIKYILRNESPVIFGDGMNSRDFTYVDNVVQANINALNKKKYKNNYNIYNISFGSQASLNEIINQINLILNKNIKAKYTKERMGDIKHSLADINKAKKELGYVPKTDLKEGLNKTINWFIENESYFTE